MELGRNLARNATLPSDCGSRQVDATPLHQIEIASVTGEGDELYKTSTSQNKNGAERGSFASLTLCGK